MGLTETGQTESLAEKIRRELNQNVFLCYQCDRCSSGCPLAEAMAPLPHQVMRSVQLDDEQVLESNTIWLCAACQTCTTRCPQGLDVAGIMDTLRIEAGARGLPPAIPEVEKFSRLFMGNISLFGRLYEIGLMASLNLATGQPFKDLPLGLDMIKRGKLKLLPSLTRSPKKVEPVEPAPNKVAYYPGCSLHSAAAEYDQTIRAVAGALELELVEPPGWGCCGSSPAHSTNAMLAITLPLRTLATVEQLGLDTVTAPCSSCFARMKTAAHTMAHNEKMARAAEAELGYSYQGQVRVQHLLDTLVERVGMEGIAARVKTPLAGLKVACYYGCLVTRPPHITEAEHPEYPQRMEKLVRALGAEPVDWSYKTDCCGGSLGLTQTPLALELTRKILQNARDCGADVVAAVCPLCHVNLDARQAQINLDFALPVLYLTQLMALAFGLGAQQAALHKNLVDPRPTLTPILTEAR